MTVISYGLYMFYWFYLTWRQYRDHTNERVFPVWHTLALFVPIYGLFRVYDHMRAFNVLMVKAGLSDTIKVGWVVTLFAITSALDWQSMKLGLQGLAQETAVLTAVLDIISIAVTTLLLLYLQGRLNAYWSTLNHHRLVASKTGMGEGVFALIGITAWLGMLSDLLGLL